MAREQCNTWCTAWHVNIAMCWMCSLGTWEEAIAQLSWSWSGGTNKLLGAAGGLYHQWSGFWQPLSTTSYMHNHMHVHALGRCPRSNHHGLTRVFKHPLLWFLCTIYPLRGCFWPPPKAWTVLPCACKSMLQSNQWPSYHGLARGARRTTCM